MNSRLPIKYLPITKSVFVDTTMLCANHKNNLTRGIEVFSTWRKPLLDSTHCYKVSRENACIHNLFLSNQIVLKCRTGHESDTPVLCAKLHKRSTTEVNARNTQRTPYGFYLLDAIETAKVLIAFDHIYRPSRDAALILALPCWQYFHIRLSVSLPWLFPDRLHCKRKVERLASVNTPEFRFLFIAEQRVSQRVLSLVKTLLRSRCKGIQNKRPLIYSR